MSDHIVLKGIVQTYLLNHKGEVDGLMLDGNRQLKVPPQVGKGLTQSIAPGSSIEAEVKAGQKSSHGQEFHFRNWSEEKLANQAEGKIHNWLVDMDGDIRGFLMNDDTQIHLPKRLRKELSEKLQIGSEVRVQGHGHKTPWGTVLKAQQVDVLVLTS